jgi:putative heme-binding domain-containing protein
LKSDQSAAWLARSEVHVSEETPVQLLASANGPLRISLNGKDVFRRDQARAFQPDSERFDAVLAKGPNRILVYAGPAKGDVEFHVRFRRKGSTAEHERLTQATLARAGNGERGRKLFFDAAKSQCVKCHRLGDQGERIGPELTGIGGRFSRVHIVESILQPSRTITPSFETQVVALKDGRVLTGVKVAETADALTLADNQGQKHVLVKAQIEERGVQPLSTMPDGLEKPLTTQEFIDLVTFLAGQK